MGSTFYSAANSPVTYADEKREVSDVYENNGKNEILQISKVGSVWYLAVKVKESGAVFGGVCITYRSQGEWGYKALDENVGPSYYDAPASLLKKLSPTTDKWAIDWRNSCQERIASKKKGAAFRFESGVGYKCDGLFGKVAGIALTICYKASPLADDRMFYFSEVGKYFRLSKKQMASVASLNQN